MIEGARPGRAERDHQIRSFIRYPQLCQRHGGAGGGLDRTDTDHQRRHQAFQVWAVFLLGGHDEQNRQSAERGERRRGAHVCTLSRTATKNASVTVRPGVTRTPSSRRWAGCVVEADFGRDGRSLHVAEIGVDGQKRGHLASVLIRQERTGFIDDPGTGADQGGGGGEQIRLLPHPLAERLRPKLPFGVRAAAPGPRSAARSVDQHHVEPAGEVVQRPAGRPDLDVTGRGTLEAVMDRRQPAPVGVGGEDLAGIGHGSGQRQRLAAGACAQVEDLLAGPCQHHRGGELAAFILDLEPPLEKRSLDLKIGMAALAGGRRDPQPLQGMGGLGDTEPGQGRARPCRGRPSAC